MPSTNVTFSNQVGLHARPAALFSRAAAGFAADVRVRKGDAEANAKSLLSVLKLDVRQGDQVTIAAQGDDADEALAALTGLVAEL